MAKHAGACAYQIAEVYAWWGNNNQAFTWLERSHTQKDSGKESLLAKFRVRRRRSRYREGRMSVICSDPNGDKTPNRALYSRRLVLTVPAGHRSKQFLRVVANSILKNNFRILDISYSPRRIAFDDHQIRVLASLDGANACLLAFKDRAIQCGNANGLHGRKSRPDEKLDFPLITEAR